MTKNYSVNLTQADSKKFKMYLQNNKIKYYSQGCYDQVNFSLELNSVQNILVNNFLNTL